MTLGAVLFLGFIILQRLSELVIAKRNTARLLARGAYEVGAAHYPVMVAMHSAWIACLVFGGYDEAVSLFWLFLFALLQILRVWILATLGPRWTTRVIVLEEPLVVRGPFRYLSHPNYTLVVAEIIVAPMVLGLVWVAVLFTLLNAAMLWVRIGVENAALSGLRQGPPAAGR
ncbi:isoprenylcysteine carboxyl methyltransferase family protein [Neptunicoccus sediminis]|uniref:isoprenylcysteine carboxyl methyltransferase family protein n=1 Tax=Neptunicoccus sediminis TaxID=1892596 RepID=UPI000845C541|nr:isoprenylcysteine carboxylmethyltransferase family protein [Neptunicoccus sediminis]